MKIDPIQSVGHLFVFHICCHRKPDAKIDYVLIDLSELKSVVNCVGVLLAQNRQYDVVIANAGLLLPKECTTPDGFETTFQVNYLSHYLLVKQLIEGGLLVKNGKIIAITSLLRKLCKYFNGWTSKHERWWEMLSPTSVNKSGWMAYARSKMALSIIAHHWNGRNGLTALSVHPGCVNSGIATTIDPIVKTLLANLGVKRCMKTLEESAQYVLSAVELEHQPGVWRNEDRVCRECSIVLSGNNGTDLENLSERMINKALNARP